jgi:hypothetical protein
MIVNLTKVIKNSEDVGLLNLFVSALAGQRFLKASLSYGDELRLHFGEPQPLSNPKLANIQRGAWVLGVRASAWRVNLNRFGIVLTAGYPPLPRSLATPAAPQDMADYANKLKGSDVIGAHAPLWFRPSDFAPGLLLLFSDGSTFELSPAFVPSDSEEDALPDWELFTPYKTYLRVGPGPVWSNLRADVPEKVAK